MITREVLKKIVSCCRKAMRTSDTVKPMYEGNGGVAEEIYGELLDTIYLILGEKTATVDESITWTVLHSDMADDECTNVLFSVYARGCGYIPGPPVARKYETDLKEGYPKKDVHLE